MYQSHKYIDTPKVDTIIWRYLDIAKLLSILEKQELFFARSDKLNDPFEGAITKPGLEELKQVYTETSNGVFKKIKERFFLNCWHANENESEAMWKLYSNSSIGISIQSTVGSLIKALSKEDRYNIYLGRVDYLDYDKDIFDYGNIFYYFLNKRNCFEHEREVRAIVDLGIENPKSKSNELHYDNGIYIRVIVNKLIETLYLAPNSPDWFVELVISIKDRYGYNFNIKKSSMSKEPLFL